MEAARREWAHDWLNRIGSGTYAGGRWHEDVGTPRTAVINPSNGTTLVELASTSPANLDLAVASARQALQAASWRTLPRRERGRILQRIGTIVRRHQAELATLITLENGKLYREAYADDMPDTADVFDYYAGWVDKIYGETCPVDADFLNYTLRVPVGVCALIVPWNFPLLLAAWKIAPALAMGNTVVLKPSPFTPLSLLRFVELLHEEADLPPGVVNLVLGDALVGDGLTRHPGIDKVSFTGSTGVGKQIVRGAAESNLKSISLELGGKSPNIVFEDVPDLDLAVDRSFTVMFSQKGEKCSEPTRFLLHRSLCEEFVERLAKKAHEIVCGDPFDPRSTQGAQCHLAHFEKVMRYIEIGKEEGARLRAGGTRDGASDCSGGLYVRPTIFDEVEPSMRIFREEIFGPVLSVTSFETEEEAIGLANATDYGLAAGLWTADVSRAHRVAHQLDAGMIFINRYGCYDFASPFGGVKQSGWGHEMAIHSLAAYTKLKSIWLKL